MLSGEYWIAREGGRTTYLCKQVFVSINFTHAKQSKAKQSKAKQSKVNIVAYIIVI